MKHILVLLFMLPGVVSAQVSENFSDNLFLESENTFGTKEKFVINAAGELQLSDAAASGTSNNAYVSLASEAIDNAVWQLSVRINAATSNSNYVRYYLAADASELSGSLNGYFVMIGNTDREISLYRQNGSTRTRIIDGEDKRIDGATVEVVVKVTRDASGHWELFSKIPSDEGFVLEGVCTDFGVSKSRFSGIYVQYSSTRSTSYFFDEWQVSGEQQVKAAVRENDIVFSELMVKPTPVVSVLPKYEYIELYNRTSERINLSGFALTDNSRHVIDNCVIQPNDYLLLCAASRFADFEHFPNAKGISSLPALTDGGKLLRLEDEEGNVVTWIEYSDAWYGGAFKAGGGWSLECIDLDNLSRNADNYAASESPDGGTPGVENSVARSNPDVISPKIEKVAISSDRSIDIFFNETMNAALLLNADNYEISGLNISHIEIQKPKNNAATIYFEENIGGSVYEISLKNMTDISGNPLETKMVKFAVPEEVEPMDVVINEIMFHAATNGEKYVELYNRSGKTLDLSALRLSNRRNEELQAGVLLSAERTLLLAGEYVLLSANCETVCAQYACGDEAQKIDIKSFPSYPVAGGDVVLVSRNGEIIDELAYSEKMHHPMVKNPIGVSLERINPDLPNADNWHSASFECGYGTPGARNSQFIEESPEDKTVWIAPETFSPDNDGNDDFLNIYYHLGENGYTANISIYDAGGRRVKKLASNALLSGSGVFRWNGESDNGAICNIGIYVVYIEFINVNGNVKKYKLPCVLSAG